MSLFLRNKNFANPNLLRNLLCKTSKYRLTTIINNSIFRNTLNQYKNTNHLLPFNQRLLFSTEEKLDKNVETETQEVSQESEEFKHSLEEEKPEMNEQISGDTQTLSFQTETRQLLDIVSNSLYTEKEVFLRELLSNASDALEKMRYTLTQDISNIADKQRSLEINVYTDINKGQLIIVDSGIGMNDKELKENLGVIARSGSKAFVTQLNEQNNAIKDDNRKLIK